VADLPAGAYDSTYFKNGGNAFGGAAVLGTTDANSLALATAGAVRVTVDTTGKVGVGTVTPQAALDVNGSVKVGNDSVCNAAKQGAIRWSGTAFQGCDGSAWNPLASGGGTRTIAPGYAFQLNKTDSVFSTANYPWTDSVPSNTGGTEVLTATITPTSATSLIEVSALVHFSEPVANTTSFLLAAFQNSTTSAFASAASNVSGATCGTAADSMFMCQANLSTVFTAGSTNPIVIHIRAGTLTGPWELNGAGGRKFGGTLASSLIVREVLQ